MMTDVSFVPDWFSKPGDTLSAMMANRGVTHRALADSLDFDLSSVRDLINGSLEIDDEIADRLVTCVGGSRSFWRNRQSTYDASLRRVADAIPGDAGSAWLKQLPTKEIVGYGWLRKPVEKKDALKAYLAYFGVNNPSEWEDRYTDFLKTVEFKATSKFDSKIGALSAWLRQGEIEASLIKTKQWDKETLVGSLEALRKLTRRKSPSQFIAPLREICAQAGVAIVFVRSPPGCRASGASRFISSEKAMVVLSFRHLSDDQFWFTLFHELGHLILHSSLSTFVDGVDTSNNLKEDEANAFSLGVLIPFYRQEEMLSLPADKNKIQRFAVSVGIASGIVVGQLQYRGVINHKQFSFLKRRYRWTEIQTALTSLGNG